VLLLLLLSFCHLEYEAGLVVGEADGHEHGVLLERPLHRCRAGG
jgi:hypothetical protein